MTPAQHAILSARIDVLSDEVKRLRESIDTLIREVRADAPTKPDLRSEHGKRGP